MEENKNINIDEETSDIEELGEEVELGGIKLD